MWLAAGLAALSHAVTLSNGFAYDDIPIISNNPNVRDAGDWSSIWLSDWWDLPRYLNVAADPGRDRLYRPLTLHSFALNYAIHGDRPAGYHLVNVLLHAGTTAVLWLLARRLLGDSRAATLAALLFAVHPVHVEAVAQLVGRAELLSALFVLLGLLAVAALHRPLAGRRSGVLLGCASGSFLLGMLAKETAVCYPALAAIVIAVRCWDDAALAASLKQSLRRAALAGVALLIPLTVYLPARYAVLEGRLVRDRPPAALYNPLVRSAGVDRLFGALHVLGRYSVLSVAPARLSCDYSFAVITPSPRLDPITCCGAIAAGGLLAACALMRSRVASRQRLAALAAMFIASYALISNTVLLIGVAVAERLLYLPSAFFCMAAGLLAAPLVYPASTAAGRKPRNLAALLAIATLAALGLRSATRGVDWANNEALFSADVATYPQSAVLNLSLAAVLQSQAVLLPPGPAVAERLRRAMELLDRAERIAPWAPDAYKVRSTVYLLKGDRRRAIEQLERVLSLNPDDATVRAELERVQELPDPK